MRPRLLFVYLQPTSFVNDDLESLSEHFDIRSFAFATLPLTKAGTITQWMRQYRWLRKEINHADVIFGWFADYHMVLPLRIGKKKNTPVVVALGGYDATHLPSLSYGVYDSIWRAPLARFVIRNVSMLVPVAEVLIRSDNEFEHGPKGASQGVVAHVKGFRTPYEVIPTGYDANAWPLGPDERDASVCSVAIVNDRRTFKLKGLDLLIKAAARMPFVSFKIVGVSDVLLPWIRTSYSPTVNVEIEPPRAREVLSEVYRWSSVYAQLSRSEGLPNVLCEAMLSGCVPVVSRVGGMPNVVGEVGEVVDEPRVENVVRAIEVALARPRNDRKQARKLIAARFSREQRSRQLRDLLNRMIQEGKQ